MEAMEREPLDGKLAEAVSKMKKILPCLRSCPASFPLEVVLPAPCRPTIIYTVGGRFAKVLIF